jgi:hypothetical protein
MQKKIKKIIKFRKAIRSPLQIKNNLLCIRTKAQ